MQDTTTFEYTNPNQIEGDSYQVAEAACMQAAHVADLLSTAASDAFKMARLAEMQRALEKDESLDPEGFYDTVLGGKILDLQNLAFKINKGFVVAAKAAAYDPNAPED